MNQPYSFHQFDEFTDSEFVDALYRTLLKREPDKSGKQHYLGMIRKGIPKYVIANDFARSGECRRNNVRLVGLGPHMTVWRLLNLPFIGAALSAVFFICTIKRQMQDFRSLVNAVHALEKTLSKIEQK